MEINPIKIETLEQLNLPQETLLTIASELQAEEREKDDHLGAILGSREYRMNEL